VVAAPQLKTVVTVGRVYSTGEKLEAAEGLVFHWVVPMGSSNGEAQRLTRSVLYHIVSAGLVWLSMYTEMVKRELSKC
jgi:hypothetical protein